MTEILGIQAQYVTATTNTTSTKNITPKPKENLAKIFLTAQSRCFVHLEV